MDVLLGVVLKGIVESLGLVSGVSYLVVVLYNVMGNFIKIV